MVNKKDIQNQRMRQYFIDATKEILKSEGMRAVNVRNIAERAGYSYATLYNYFDDLKDLVFYCVKDFQTEIEQFVAELANKNVKGKAKLKELSLAFTNYFVQYPGIFELFFIERTREISNAQSSEVIVNFFDKLCKNEWQYCIDNAELTETMAVHTQKSLYNTILGSLLLYLHRQYPSSHKSFVKMHTSQVESILGL